MKCRTLIVCLIAACSGAEADVVDYVNDVLPIMKSHCWDCHSNEKSVKGSLALDNFEEVRDYQIGKFNIIRPGNPAESGFLERLKLESNHTDFMPRKGDPLPKEELATIEKWIEDGAIIDAKKPTGEEARRLGEVKSVATGSSGPEGQGAFLQWKNKAGKEIEAKMLSLSGSSVKLVLRSGASYDVNLEDLSQESVALARRLAGKE